MLVCHQRSRLQNMRSKSHCQGATHVMKLLQICQTLNYEKKPRIDPILMSIKRSQCLRRTVHEHEKILKKQWVISNPINPSDSNHAYNFDFN